MNTPQDPSSPSRSGLPVISFFFLVLSNITGAYISYSFISGAWSYKLVYYIPAFFIFSLLTILLPTQIRIKWISGCLTGFALWFVSLLNMLSIVASYHLIRNIAPVRYSVEFFWEEGLCLDFRTDNSFKAMNIEIFNNTLSYGHYKMIDSRIILKDDVWFGPSKLKDTLIMTDRGFAFTLETPWRNITSDTLYFSSYLCR